MKLSMLCVALALLAVAAPALAACPDGTTLTKGLCVPCPTGTAGTGGTCVQCVSGKVPNAGKTECVCQPGFRTASILAACHACPAGEYGTDGLTCHKCPVGTFSLKGASSIKACTAALLTACDAAILPGQTCCPGSAVGQACGSGSVAASCAANGVCTACGGLNQPCCAGTVANQACAGGAGFCTVAAGSTALQCIACGQPGQPCCAASGTPNCGTATATSLGLNPGVCVNGICQACGAQQALCCAGPRCEFATTPCNAASNTCPSHYEG